MRSSDRVLTGIVVGAVLLAGGAFAVILLRPEPTYLSEATPEGVAHNYLLALQRGDYPRAYAYLSPQLSRYPRSAVQFQQQFEDSYLPQVIKVSSQTIATAVIEDARATVEIRETSFYGGGLFDSGQVVTTFEMELVRVGAEWKIKDSERYFLPCWRSLDVC